MINKYIYALLFLLMYHPFMHAQQQSEFRFNVGNIAIVIALGNIMDQYTDSKNTNAVVRSAKKHGNDTSKLTKTNNQGIAYIVSAAYPMVATGQQITLKHKSLFTAAYKNCLSQAATNHVDSIAFPSVDTSIFGYDAEKTAPLAINAVLDFVQHSTGNSIREIRFVLSEQDVFNTYVRSMIMVGMIPSQLTI